MYGMLEHMAYLNWTLERPTLLQVYIKQVHGQDVFGSSSLYILLLCRPLLDDVSVGCLGQGIIGLLHQCKPMLAHRTHPSSTISFSDCPTYV